METVLFSCVGTTDPIRNHRDGPLLHILRQFRPDAIVLFITHEMRTNADKENWTEKLRTHMQQHWGYAPRWIEEHVPIKDPSNLDLVYDMMDPLLKRYLRKYVQDEILVNLSSGTPQLKYLMIDLATDLRYKCRGIQVTNPTGTAGKGGRTNEETYRVADELSANLDEDPQTYLCHWSEPEMISVKRNQKWEQLRSVLQQRDFEIAYRLQTADTPWKKEDKPEKGSAVQLLNTPTDRMLLHLFRRSRLIDNADTYNLAASLNTAKELYPIRFHKTRDADTKQLCEYYLILRNLQIADRITEFILRLNPFIVELQMCLINRLLQEKYGFALDALMDPGKLPERDFFLTNRLRQYSLPLFQKITGYFPGEGVRDADMSIVLGNAFLKALEADSAAIDLFADCEWLNSRLRNSAAHSLKHYVEADIRTCLGYGSGELTRRIENLIPAVFPQFPEAQFRQYYQVYDFGIDYILSRK